MTAPETSSPGADRIAPALTFMLALACGVVVANIYYVQPLIGPISRDFGMSVASAGLLVTVTQLGYAAGLLMVVPLGDILENRRLILVMLAVLVIVLAAAFFAPSAAIFLAASLVIGITSSAVQVIVPLAGHLAPDASRGRVVGTVVSGLLFGIMLSRPLASFFAQAIGDRSIFIASAIAVTALIFLLLARLPRRQPQGMPYLAVLKSLGPLFVNTPALHRRGGYQAAMFGAFSVFWTAVPLLLEGPLFHFSQRDIGLFALVGAGGALVSPLAGRAADAGYTYSITGLALVAGVVAFGIALAGGLLTSWPLLVVAGLVLDMAVAANLVVGQRAIFAVDAATRGRLNGLFLALFFVGGAAGSLVAGIAYARGGWTAVSIVGLVLPALALVYYASEKREERPPAA